MVDVSTVQPKVPQQEVLNTEVPPNNPDNVAPETEEGAPTETTEAGSTTSDTPDPPVLPEPTPEPEVEPSTNFAMGILQVQNLLAEIDRLANGLSDGKVSLADINKVLNGQHTFDADQLGVIGMLKESFGLFDTNSDGDFDYGTVEIGTELRSLAGNDDIVSDEDFVRGPVVNVATNAVVEEDQEPPVTAGGSEAGDAGGTLVAAGDGQNLMITQSDGSQYFVDMEAAEFLMREIDRLDGPDLDGYITAQQLSDYIAANEGSLLPFEEALLNALSADFNRFAGSDEQLSYGEAGSDLDLLADTGTEGEPGRGISDRDVRDATTPTGNEVQVPDSVSRNTLEALYALPGADDGLTQDELVAIRDNADNDMAIREAAAFLLQGNVYSALDANSADVDGITSADWEAFIGRDTDGDNDALTVSDVTTTEPPPQEGYSLTLTRVNELLNEADSQLDDADGEVTPAELQELINTMEDGPEKDFLRELKAKLETVENGVLVIADGITDVDSDGMITSTDVQEITPTRSASVQIPDHVTRGTLEALYRMPGAADGLTQAELIAIRDNTDNDMDIRQAAAFLLQDTVYSALDTNSADIDGITSADWEAFIRRDAAGSNSQLTVSDIEATPTPPSNAPTSTTEDEINALFDLNASAGGFTKAELEAIAANPAAYAPAGTPQETLDKIQNAAAFLSRDDVFQFLANDGSIDRSAIDSNIENSGGPRNVLDLDDIQTGGSVDNAPDQTTREELNALFDDPRSAGGFTRSELSAITRGDGPAARAAAFLLRDDVHRFIVDADGLITRGQIEFFINRAGGRDILDLADVQTNAQTGDAPDHATRDQLDVLFTLPEAEGGFTLEELRRIATNAGGTYDPAAVAAAAFLSRDDVFQYIQQDGVIIQDHYEAVIGNAGNRNRLDLDDIQTPDSGDNAPDQTTSEEIDALFNDPRAAGGFTLRELREIAAGDGPAARAAAFLAREDVFSNMANSNNRIGRREIANTIARAGTPDVLDIADVEADGTIPDGTPTETSREEIDALFALPQAAGGFTLEELKAIAADPDQYPGAANAAAFFARSDVFRFLANDNNRLMRGAVEDNIRNSGEDPNIFDLNDVPNGATATDARDQASRAEIRALFDVEEAQDGLTLEELNRIANNSSVYGIEAAHAADFLRRSDVFPFIVVANGVMVEEDVLAIIGRGGNSNILDLSDVQTVSGNEDAPDQATRSDLNALFTLRAAAGGFDLQELRRIASDPDRYGAEAARAAAFLARADVFPFLSNDNGVITQGAVRSNINNAGGNDVLDLDDIRTLGSGDVPDSVTEAQVDALLALTEAQNGLTLQELRDIAANSDIYGADASAAAAFLARADVNPFVRNSQGLIGEAEIVAVINNAGNDQVLDLNDVQTSPLPDEIPEEVSSADVDALFGVNLAAGGFTLQELREIANNPGRYGEAAARAAAFMSQLDVFDALKNRDGIVLRSKVDVVMTNNDPDKLEREDVGLSGSSGGDGNPPSSDGDFSLTLDSARYYLGAADGDGDGILTQAEITEYLDGRTIGESGRELLEQLAAKLGPDGEFNIADDFDDLANAAGGPDNVTDEDVAAYDPNTSGGDGGTPTTDGNFTLTLGDARFYLNEADGDGDGVLTQAEITEYLDGRTISESGRELLEQLAAKLGPDGEFNIEDDFNDLANAAGGSNNVTDEDVAAYNPSSSGDGPPASEVRSINRVSRNSLEEFFADYLPDSGGFSRAELARILNDRNADIKAREIAKFLLRDEVFADLADETGDRSLIESSDWRAVIGSGNPNRLELSDLGDGPSASDVRVRNHISRNSIRNFFNPNNVPEAEDGFTREELEGILNDRSRDIRDREIAAFLLRDDVFADLAAKTGEPDVIEQSDWEAVIGNGNSDRLEPGDLDGDDGSSRVRVPGSVMRWRLNRLFDPDRIPQAEGGLDRDELIEVRDNPNVNMKIREAAAFLLRNDVFDALAGDDGIIQKSEWEAVINRNTRNKLEIEDLTESGDSGPDGSIDVPDRVSKDHLDTFFGLREARGGYTRAELVAIRDNTGDREYSEDTREIAAFLLEHFDALAGQDPNGRSTRIEPGDVDAVIGNNDPNYLEPDDFNGDSTPGNSGSTSSDSVTRAQLNVLYTLYDTGGNGLDRSELDAIADDPNAHPSARAAAEFLLRDDVFSDLAALGINDQTIERGDWEEVISNGNPNELEISDLPSSNPQPGPGPNGSDYQDFRLTKNQARITLAKVGGADGSLTLAQLTEYLNNPQSPLTADERAFLENLALPEVFARLATGADGVFIYSAAQGEETDLDRLAGDDEFVSDDDFPDFNTEPPPETGGLSAATTDVQLWMQAIETVFETVNDAVSYDSIVAFVDLFANSVGDLVGQVPTEVYSVFQRLTDQAVFDAVAGGDGEISFGDVNSDLFNFASGDNNRDDITEEDFSRVGQA